MSSFLLPPLSLPPPTWLAGDGLAEPASLEAALLALVEHAPVAMAVLDPELRYRLANRRWVEQFHLQDQLPLTGRSQFDVFPELHPGWHAIYQRALQGEAVSDDQELLVTAAEGEAVYRWDVRAWGQGGDGRAAGLILVCEILPAPAAPVPATWSAPGPAADQLERRRLEDDLAQARQELRLLREAEAVFTGRENRRRQWLDALPWGVLVLDELGSPVEHNERFETLLGRPLPPGEPVASWLAAGCPDEASRQEALRLWREDVWRRQLVRVLTLTALDGQVRQLEFQPVSLPDGGVLVGVQEVTESWRREEQLRAVEARCRSLFLETPLAALLADAAGRVLEINPAAEALLGRCSPEVCGLAAAEVAAQVPARLSWAGDPAGLRLAFLHAAPASAPPPSEELGELLRRSGHARIQQHLQALSSLLHLEAYATADAGAVRALRSSQQRLRAVADLHRLLADLGAGAPLSLQAFAEGLVERLCLAAGLAADQVTVDLDLPTTIDEAVLLPLALILHEALANAFLHAFPDGRPGRVEVLLIRRESGELRVLDDGVGQPASWQPGQGIRIVECLAAQMGGEVRWESRANGGVELRLQFP